MDQRRPGWREAGFLLLRGKRKEEGKTERKRERKTPNKEALELIERGYKSEHKSLTPKKTSCATVREGYVRKQHKVVVVKVFFFFLFFERVDGGFWGSGGELGAQTVMLKQEGRGKEGDGVLTALLEM